MAEKKEKKYVSDNAQLMAEWNWEKNNELELTPQTLTLGSNKKAWWKCNKGHEWQAMINHRNKGRGCPYCSSKIVLKGYNDLQTVNPALAKEWNFDKNNGLMPTEVTCNSHKKVWWKCSKGHEWQAQLANRNNGNGCPYCAGQWVIQGETDLETNEPFLTKEWLTEENLPLTPKLISWKSNKKVWWQCSSCGNKWQATVVNRVNGRGCPKCYSRNQTSFPEQAIFYYIFKNYPDAINRYKAEFLQGMELDIYIPSKNVAIEYDGVAWHTSVSSQEREKRKHSICKSRGIFLIRIKEQIKVDDNCDALIATDYDNLNFRELDRVISELSRYIRISSKIDTERDKRTIQLQFLTNKKAQSILHLHPEIAVTWKSSKNGELTPEMFSPGSTDKVWWKCSICGNEWETRIDHRCAGAGCPICSTDEAMRRRNSNYINKNGSLADHHPELVAE